MAKNGKFEKLVVKADEAGKLRRFAVNPDVVALRVEKTMTAVTVLFWSGVALGLGFTIPNVAAFVGGITGWLVSPAINLPLIALLIAHSVMARYDVSPGWEVQVGKWVLMIFEYGMNTWTAWASGMPDEIFKHSVPMVIVVFCAEGVTDLRAGMTRCVHKAYAFAAENVPTRKDQEEPAPIAPPAVKPEPEPATPVVPAVKPEPKKPAPVVETAPKTVGKRAEKLAADLGAMSKEWPGSSFLVIEPERRAKAVMDFFGCGGSRAYRLITEYTKLVELEYREGVRQ